MFCEFIANSANTESLMGALRKFLLDLSAFVRLLFDFRIVASALQILSNKTVAQCNCFNKRNILRRLMKYEFIIL